MNKNIAFSVIVLALIFGGTYFYSSNSTPSEAKTVVYKCSGNKSITATFYSGATSNVDVALSTGEKFSMSRAASTAGVAYASKDGTLSFITRGGEATINTSNGQETFSGCTVQD